MMVEMVEVGEITTPSYNLGIQNYIERVKSHPTVPTIP